MSRPHALGSAQGVGFAARRYYRDSVKKYHTLADKSSIKTPILEAECDWCRGRFPLGMTTSAGTYDRLCSGCYFCWKHGPPMEC